MIIEIGVMGACVADVGGVSIAAAIVGVKLVVIIAAVGKGVNVWIIGWGGG